MLNKSQNPPVPKATLHFLCIGIVTVTHRLVCSVIKILVTIHLIFTLHRLSSTCCYHTPLVLLLDRSKHNLVSLPTDLLIMSVWGS